MRKIPEKLRRRLCEDDFMKCCVSCGSQLNIEWEHPWTYAGKQINEVWSIVPVCRKCHRGNNGTVGPKVKDRARKASIERLIDCGFENLNLYKKPMDDTWEQRINYYTKYYE